MHLFEYHELAEGVRFYRFRYDIALRLCVSAESLSVHANNQAWDCTYPLAFTC